jgi:transporter family protein
MWLVLGFLSALFLGFYDLAKKTSLRSNAVLPVLLLNTFFCSMLLLPLVAGSFLGMISSTSDLFVPWNGWASQSFILIKSFTVLASWVLGYYGIKYLPLTIVGPINATRPIMALVGALLIFGERLSLMQWLGVITAIISFFMLSRTGKKEGIDFRRNRAVIMVVLAAVLGAANSLYDKFLMAPPENGGIGLDRMEVLSWYNIYQCVWMSIMTYFLWRPNRSGSSPFTWRWSIPLISLFLVAADFTYMTALSSDNAMISVLSLVRRSNVLVSFTFGVLLLGEKNWKDKAFDLFLVAVGMLFIWLGTE